MLSDNPLKSISPGAFRIPESKLSIYLIRTELKAVSMRSFIGDFSNLTASISMEDGKIGAVKFTDSYGKEDERLTMQLGVGDSEYISLFGIDDKDIKESLLDAFFRAGFASTRNKSNEVGPCPTGTFVNASVNDSSKLECLECPAGGFYSDTKAYVNFSCKTCPDGTFVHYNNAPGKSARDCIACPQGTDTSIFAGYKACKCLSGFYRFHLFEKCTKCDKDGLTCLNDYANLTHGYWWNWTDNEHKQLYENFTRFILNITPVSGVNSSRNNNTIIEYPYVLPRPHKCPRSESCKGGLDSECETGYKGPLCEVCSDGFYKQFQTCKKCPSRQWMAVQVSIMAVVITAIIALVIWTSKKKSKNISGRSWVDIILARLKIVIGFYQVTFGVIEAFAFIKWPKSLALIGKYSEMIQMNVLQIAPIHCLFKSLEMDAFERLFAILAVNATVIIVSIVIYGLIKLYLIRSRIDERDIATKSSQAKEVILRNMFFVLYVTYLSTCSKTANVMPLACRELCLDDENVKDCPKFLKVDYNIGCQGPRYNRLVIVAYCAVIYIILLPTASFFVLWKHRKVIKEAENKTNDDEQEQGKEVLTGLRFLFENYNAKSWYWEFIETVRKVVLTSGLILIGGESRAYIGLACVVSGLYGMLFAYFRPIVDSFENKLMLTSLAVTFVNLGIGAVSKIPKENLAPEIDQHVDHIAFDMLVIGANSLVIGLLVIQYLTFIYRYVKEWRKNPQWSFSCCLAMLLPLNQLQGDLRGMAGKNILRQRLQSGRIKMPTISNTFQDTGVIDFQLEEIDEANEEETQDIDEEAGSSSEVNNTDSPDGEVTTANVHEPLVRIYETSV